MKKFLKIFLPIFLALCILCGTVWYFLVYDRDMTRDILLSCARFFDKQGETAVSGWLYDITFENFGDTDEITLELAYQHLENGNPTQAEVTLYKAIRNGGGADLYIALSKVYLSQDKVLDAVTLLDSVTNPTIKAQLDAIRPAAPKYTKVPGFYNQYIQVDFLADDAKLYVNTEGQYPSIEKDEHTGPFTLQAGENVYNCVAINDEGIVSPMAVYGYTVGGVIEQITFKDAVMEEAIRAALGVTADKTLYSNALWLIESFTVPSDAVDYSDLRYFAFVKNLTIENGKAGQLSVIENMTNLQTLTIKNTAVSAEELNSIAKIDSLTKLTLSGCSISSITPLHNCAKITYLDLSNNAIRNISGLKGMPNLETLNMHGNALTDLSELMASTALKSLDVSNNSIADLSPIYNISGLTELVAANNIIEDITGIENLSSITDLDLSHNRLTDASCAASCATLTKLNISNNALTDINALSALTNLTDLDFSNNQVKEIPTFNKSSNGLRNINGSYNQISTLKPLEGLTSLRTVTMDYNTEISLVTWLERCPMLIRVSVFGTKVKDVSCLTDQEIIVNYNPVQ